MFLHKKHFSRFLFILTAAASPIFSQTVTVDKTLASPDNSTTFNSLRTAIKSFDRVTSLTTGVNAADPAPNVINIVSFGPYDEVLPLLQTGGLTSGGAIDRCYVLAGDGITINGVGPKPLILAQNCYNFASVVALGQVAYNFNNVVLAQSNVALPARYFVNTVGFNANINVTSSVLTALPTTAASYTSLANLPSGILDGSRPLETSGYARASTFRNDRGAVQVENVSTITLINTVLTQWGNGSVGPAAVARSANSGLVIGPGCVLRNNTAGVRMLDAASRLKIEGTSSTRVVIGNNDLNGNGRIWLTNAASASIREVNFFEAATGNNAIAAEGTIGSLRISECIFGEGRRGATTSTAIVLSTTPSALQLDNLTVINHAFPLRLTSAQNLTITDSIFSDYDVLATGTGNTITLDHSAYFSATGALASGGLTVTPVSSINANPNFTSTLYGASGFAEVTNVAYANQASDGSHLNGGGTVSGDVPVELSSFEIL